MASHPAITAREAYHRGDYLLAERLFRSLCTREPHEPVWQLDLAALLITLIRYEEAAEALGVAAHYGAGNPDTLRQVALCYFSMYRSGEAKRILSPAAAQGHLPSVLGLMQVMERQGQLEETLELLEQTLRRHPGHGELLLLRAQVLVRQGQLEKAELAAQTLLKAGLPLLLNAKAGYLLAGLLDRSGRHPEAVELLLQVKQALRAQPGIAPLQKQYRNRMTLARELVSAFSAAQWDSWRREAAENPLPFRPALLCGHPRSGTTLLEAQIERLENVLSFDETGAFDGGALSSAGLVGRVNLMRSLRPNGDAPAMSARSHYARSISSLHGGPPVGEPLVVDKNPSQLVNLPLWLRVMPEVRILLALRDPRDVVVSSYFFDLPPNVTGVQFLDWESTARHYSSLMDLWQQMKEKLPAACWLESRYEDLVAEPGKETSRVAGFLGLSPTTKAPGNDSATLHSPNYATVQLPVHARSIGRWHHFEAQLETSKKWLQPFLQAFSYD